MKYLIVDDEPLAVKRLQKMLEFLGVTNILTANNGRKAVEMVRVHHPHIVFLDIEMPVLTGIEAAPIIKEISPETEIIFCTAYDDFALKAFDLSASDYLLKPVSKDRLSQALNKIQKNDTVLSLTYQQSNDLTSIALDEVYCFVSEEKSTFMHCANGMIIIDDSLVTLEAKFPHHLLRINRNALINKSELLGIHKDHNSACVKLKNTDYQPQISRRNIAAVKELLK
jgi:two-component system response regulator AlgR